MRIVSGKMKPVLVCVSVLAGCNLFTPVQNTDASNDLDPTVASDMSGAADARDGGDATSSIPDIGPDVIPENCGDAVVDSDEQCDRGDDNSDEPNATCRTNCRSRRCSDGIVDETFGEQCDDGNRRSHDGCSSTCLIESPVWTSIEYPHAIRNHTAVYDPDRDVIVLFGGRFYGGGERSGETWEFDGTSWTKLTPANSPTPRFDPRMVYDPANDRVILFGGHTGSLSDETWSWDGTNWTQITTQTTPPPRSDHGMVWVSGQSRILMFGGEAPSGQHGDLWAFDGSDWSELNPNGNSPDAREEFVMLAEGETVWVHGGEVGNTSGNDELWELDLTANGGDGRWTLLDSGGTPALADHQGIVVPGTGRLVVFGGSGDGLYVWSGGTWQEVPRARPWPARRDSFAGVWDSTRDRMVIVGGQHGSIGPLADVWAFDLSGWTLLATDHPPVRDDARMVYDPDRQRIVIYGGDDESGELFRDTWELRSETPRDALRWERVDNGGPQAETAGVTYDRGTQSIVLFGGRIGTEPPFGGTWVFDGDWEQQTTSEPPARYWSAMVYDSNRERSVLVSGCQDGPEGLEDAWAWEGGAWSELASIPMDVHCWGDAVYDPVRDRIVTYTRGADEVTPLTLEFDGTTWSTHQGESPAAREEVAMTYDYAARRTLMLGGRLSDGSGRTGELWAFDGTAWEQVTTPDEESPSPRHSVAMVYEPIRRQNIVFSANTTSDNDHTTWMFRWENPATPDEVCGNDEDDDADGAVDCNDPDCEFHPGCR